MYCIGIVVLQGMRLVFFDWISNNSSKLEFNPLPYSNQFEYFQIEHGLNYNILAIEDGNLQIEKAPMKMDFMILNWN